MDTLGKAVKSVNSKLAISKSSSSSTKSVGVTTRSMLKKLKESSQMSSLVEYVEKNLPSPSYASEGDANKSPPSSPHFMFSYSFTTNVAQVMVTNATTIKEQFTSLTRAIEGLTKHVQEQDAQITRLINKADNVDASHIMGKQVEAHDEVEASTKEHYTEKDKSAKKLQISSDRMIPVDQLNNSLKEQSETRSREVQGHPLLTPSLTLQGLTTLRCQRVINHQSFSNLMARVTLSSTWIISLKRATMQEHMAVI
ncbi:UNVERIFIED_CONTAM: hypothetical protein Sradi_2525100 [Sesamum radiatum]|uniref:Uncharacterized protein n=1 Tax=Sesamum radiatum TaxID=300843 RepID=A0AAW2SKR2_SESRA